MPSDTSAEVAGEARSGRPAARRRDRLATGVIAAAHVYALGPLAIAVFVTLTDRLTANPIEDLTRRLGQDALLMLTLSLVITPLVWLVGAGWRRPGAEAVEGIRRRSARALRPLGKIFGLYAFAYACLHLLMFAAVDYGLAPRLLAEAIFEKRYALVGMVAFVLLALLAGASTAGGRKRIGAAWVPFQRLVYPAALLVVLHMMWAAKVVTPARMAWAATVIVLLVLRIPLWWWGQRLEGRPGGSVGDSGTTPLGRMG